MTFKDIERLIALGEGYGVEFKESPPRDLARDLVGFANGNGGHILLGVRDNGAVVGFALDNRTRAQIEDVARNCDPAIRVHVDQVGGVAVVSMSDQKHKPYSCSSGFFIRNGAATQKMTRDEILALLEAHSAVAFERRAADDFKPASDLDPEKIIRFRKEANLSATLSDREVLVNLCLITSRKKATNACVLFFGKDPHRFHPSHFINCAVFKGTDRTEVIDRKDFTRGLLDNLDDAWAFLKKHLSVRYEFKELQRIEKYEIPLEALREALVNAIIHRDYSIQGANISVHVFDDRVEIVSPGSFLRPITPKNIGGLSLRRNELIADAFARLPYVEKMGTGVEKIRRLCRDAMVSMPTFLDTGFVSIVFRRQRVKAAAQETAQETAGGSRDRTSTRFPITRMRRSPRRPHSHVLQKIEPFLIVTCCPREYIQIDSREKYIRRFRYD